MFFCCFYNGCKKKISCSENDCFVPRQEILIGFFFVLLCQLSKPLCFCPQLFDPAVAHAHRDAGVDDTFTALHQLAGAGKCLVADLLERCFGYRLHRQNAGELVIDIVRIQDACRKRDIFLLQFPEHRDSRSAACEDKDARCSLRPWQLDASEARVKRTIVNLVQFADDILAENCLRCAEMGNSIALDADDLI